MSSRPVISSETDSSVPVSVRRDLQALARAMVSAPTAREVRLVGGAAAADLQAHIDDPVDAHAASAITYDNATSGLTATDVQAAVDEVAGEGVSVARRWMLA